MEKIRDYRKNSTRGRRSSSLLRVNDESTAIQPGRAQASKARQRRPLVLATMVVALALLPLAPYGFVRAQDDGSMNANSVQTNADERTIQFDLVPAADAIADCFPNATAKVTVLLTADEVGTDTFMLSVKRFRPNTTFAVFLTELPVAPFGSVQYLADLTTNNHGKGSVEVKTLIEKAFSSQGVNGQRVRKELNHVVLWFSEPADANECFGVAPITPFDGDGVAGPAAMSSKNTLPGAPLL